MKYFIVFLFSVTLFSCLDYRGRLIKENSKLLREGLITKQQYDSIIDTFYSLEKEKKSFRGSPLKFQGVYVNKYLEFDSINYYFSVIKLDTLGNLYLSQKLNFPPNNNKLKTLYVFKNRYNVHNGELLFETLQIKNLKTYNVIQYGKISGDTLVFYKNINIQDQSYNSDIIPSKKYVYVDSLIESITYPPQSPPVNNR